MATATTPFQESTLNQIALIDEEITALESIGPSARPRIEDLKDRRRASALAFAASCHTKTRKAGRAPRKMPRKRCPQCGFTRLCLDCLG